MQFATTLGWTLIHFVWQGFIVLLLYSLIMPVLRNKRPEARYLFSVFTLGLLSVLPLVTYAYLSAQAAAGITSGLQTLASIAVNATSDSMQFELSTLLEPALPYAVMAWLAGVFVMTIRFSIGLSEVSRLRKTAEWDVPLAWQNSLDSLVERMNISGEIGLAMSNLVQSPLVIGWLKPLILVPPSALAGLSPLQLEMILAHELEHIRRWDYLVNLWQVAVESLLFYHPAVRIVSRRIRVDRESCCDDAAVSLCGNPIAYARALAHLEGLRQGNLLAVNFQMGIADGRLLDRIQRLVGRSRYVQQGSLWFTGAFMIGILTMSAVATHYSLQSFRGNDAELNEIATDLSAPKLLAPRVSSKTLENILQDTPTLVAKLDSPDPIELDPIVDDSNLPDAASQPVPVVKKAFSEPGINSANSVTIDRDATIDAPIEAAAQDISPETTQAEEVLAKQITQPVVDNAATTTDIIAAESTELPQHKPVLSGGKLLHAVSPEFPRAAKRDKISGHVKVVFTVDKNGRVRNAEIIEAEPKTYFEDAALDVVSQWRFDPFHKDGKAINKRVVQQIDFNLDVYLANKASRGCYRMTGSRICRELPKNGKKDQRVAVIKLAN